MRKFVFSLGPSSSRLLFCALPVVCVLANAVTTAEAHQTNVRVAALAPKHRQDKDLPNFAEVGKGVYRGAAPTAVGLEKLKTMGVKTIVDFRIEKHGQVEEAKEAQALGFERLRIPLGREAPTKKQVSLFLATINDPGKRPVFIHCQYGADRTGAMVGIYRVTQQGWTFDKAYAEMRRYGFKPYLAELKGAVQEHSAPR